MGYVTDRDIVDEMSKNLSYWLPYMFGTVMFEPNEIKYATQSRLDLINYASAQKVKLMRGEGLDDFS